MQPRQSYLICATPRSGSTLFCEILLNSGIAGRPREYFEFLKETGLPRQAEEYFRSSNPDTENAHINEILQLLGNPVIRKDEERLAQWAGMGYENYLKSVIEEATTSNGVFGAKMMWGYLDDFLGFARQIPDYTSLSAHDLLTNLFPQLRYIMVTRRKKERQVVSLWKAIQTQRWRQDVGAENAAAEASWPNKDLVFHYDALYHLEQQIEAQEQGWKNYFAEIGIEPLVIVYEDLVQSLEATIYATLEYLAIPIPENWEFHAPTMQKQADTQSEDWLQLYRQMKREKGVV